MTSKPAPNRRLRRPVIRLIVLALTLWAGGCAALYLAQDDMLFPRHVIPAVAHGRTLQGALVMGRALPEGGNAVAWYVPALENAAWPRRLNGEGGSPLVVYCHGNAELIDDQVHVVTAYRQMGFAVLLPEYRGYGRSDGKPSQQAIGDDCEAFLNQVLERNEVDPQRIVMHGCSLGAAVAVDLATRHKPAALVLESPFRSVVAIAHGYGAPGFLVKNPYRNDRALPKLALPTLMFHGRDDRVIPVSHSRKLAELVPTAEYHERDGGHNERLNTAQWAIVRRFLTDHGIIPATTNDEADDE